MPKASDHQTTCEHVIGSANDPLSPTKMFMQIRERNASPKVSPSAKMKEPTPSPCRKTLFSSTKIGKPRHSPLFGSGFRRKAHPADGSLAKEDKKKLVNSTCIKRLLQKSPSVNRILSGILTSPIKNGTPRKATDQTKDSASDNNVSRNLQDQFNASLVETEYDATEISEVTDCTSVCMGDELDEDQQHASEDLSNFEDENIDHDSIIDQYGLNPMSGPFSPSKKGSRPSFYKSFKMMEQVTSPSKSKKSISSGSSSYLNLSGLLRRGAPKNSEQSICKESIEVKTSPTKYHQYVQSKFGGSIADSILNDFFEEDEKNNEVSQ